MSTNIWLATKSGGWELGELLSVNEDTGAVDAIGSEGQKTYPKEKTHRTDPSHFDDMEDLCSMNHLHEAPLTDCLRRRFEVDKIYTTTGDVLISVNPYRKIPGLYEKMLNYLDSPEDGEIQQSATKPHVFKIANYALSEMVYGRGANASVVDESLVNQSIVVSGESGAGKTEASKQVMSFLIEADKDLNTPDASKRVSLKLGDIIRKVLMESNIILEAFGNAKTVRNDNSSRFGKYIKLQYDGISRIVSAYTETFLLEKSRLVNIGLGERNYHVFYQLMRSCTDSAMLAKLHLKSPDAFKLLLDEEGKALHAEDDAMFPNLEKAMVTVGCSKPEIESIWQLIAVILHMSNFSFAASADGSTIVTSPSMPIDDLTAILGVSTEMFMNRITTQRVKASNRSSVTVKVLAVHEVQNNIFALIKWMYSTMFSWLVRKINYAHCTMTTADVKAEKFIGILDIFGFEILQTNSFEQLCINYTNERLQQQFNEYVFEGEQNEYRTEGLDWTVISYKDNQHVIDLIAKKPLGLLIILEGQGMLNRSSDDSALIAAFNSTHDKKSLAYEKSRFASNTFTIKHFAGDVVYDLKGFMDKNNDSLQEDLMELMVTSSSNFVQNAIVSPDATAIPNSPGFIGTIAENMLVHSAGNLSVQARDTAAVASTAKRSGKRTSLAHADSSGKKLASTVTVSYQFRGQLDMLILTLRATSPHYIKCIKPNSIKSPGVYDTAMVLQQLRYSGALEVVRIRQEGFPISMTFATFYKNFELLAFKRGWRTAAECSPEEAKEYSSILCSEVSMTPGHEFQLGHTKVFLRSESYEKIHLAIAAFLSRKVVPLQTFARKRQAMKAYQRVRHAVTLFQSYARMRPRKAWYRKVMAARAEERRKEEERRMAVEAKYREEQERRRKELEALDEARKKEELARREVEEKHRARVRTLSVACAAGTVASVREHLMQHPEDLQERDEENNGRTLLQSAMLGGNMELIRFLCPTVEDLNTKDDTGNTAVHYAASALIPQKLKFFQDVTDIIEPHVMLEAAIAGETVHAITGLPGPPPGTALGELAPAAATDSPSFGTTHRGTLATNIYAMEDQLEELAAETIQKLVIPDGKNVLKEGWLSKRGESQQWRKRWVVLKTDGLMYFRNSKDKVPRDSLSFAKRNDLRILRVEDKPTAIDILTNEKSKRKNRSRVSLMAETEAEMQEWMNLLKAVAGVEAEPLRNAPKIHTNSPALKAALLSSTNPEKETALHIVCRTHKDHGCSTEEFTELMSLVAWMVGNGSPLNACTTDGFTPLHTALKAGNFQIAKYLASKGANPKFVSEKMPPDAPNPLEVASTAGAASVDVLAALNFAYATFEMVVGDRLTLMPPRLRGFHYVSLGLYSQQITATELFIDSAQADNYGLVVSAYDVSCQLLEPGLSTNPPIVLGTSSSSTSSAAPQTVLWLSYWYMTFPLDNVKDGSYIVIELKRRTERKLMLEQSPTLMWTKISIDKNRINTERLRLQLSPGPVVLSSSPSSSNAGGGGGVASKLSSYLDFDVIVNKRGGKEASLY